MDNQGYKADNATGRHDLENGGELKSETDKVIKKSKVRKSYNKSKNKLQSNKYTKDWFPPSGNDRVKK